MKKTIPALLLACVLFACKKDTNSIESPASQSKVPVKFSLENFLVSQQDMSNNGRVETDPSLTGFYRLYYMAFASDGSTASYIEQDSTNTNFGIISDSLLPGTYTVVLGAWNRMNNVSAPNITAKHDELASAEFTNLYARNAGDFFYKKLQITVSNGSPSNNDVTLNRLVGYLKVELKDALPGSDPFEALTVDIENVPQSYMINTDLATNNYSQYHMDRTSQTTWEYYNFGSSTPANLHLNWRDKTTNTWQSRSIQINFTANKKTIVSGYLHGVPSAGSFTTKVSPNWSTDSTVVSIN
jgi:hypothetical protein